MAVFCDGCIGYIIGKLLSTCGYALLNMLTFWSGGWLAAANPLRAFRSN